MGTFAQRLRKAREIEVQVDGGLIFVARRPTDVEMIRVSQDVTPERWLDFIIGWKKADGTPPSEIDLGVENGEPHPIPFNRDDMVEYVSDNAAVYSKVVGAILDAYNAHSGRQGEAVKN